MTNKQKDIISRLQNGDHTVLEDKTVFKFTIEDLMYVFQEEIFLTPLSVGMSKMPYAAAVIKHSKEAN